MAIQFVASQFADNSVTNDKLAGSISASKLAGSIGNDKLANSAVTIAGLSVSLGGSITVSSLGGALPLDDLAAPDAAVSFNSQKITNLASPAASTDAANKAYVDSVAQGLDLKESVKVATTGNITLSGLQTIDGVALVATNRVLVKDQTDASENGIYLVSGSGWSRSDDFAVGEDEAGAFVFIEMGTVNGDNGFVCTNNKGDAVVGTDDLSFTQFNGAGQIVAGDGMQKSGNTLAVDLKANGGLVIESGKIAVDLDASSISGTLDNDYLTNDSMVVGGVTLSLGDTNETPSFDLTDATNYPTSSLVGTITNTQLAGSIANSKLANSSVSFGGISLSLGGSDDTPAFDLADATNYPTSSLVGTITNAQLAGSIANDKLVNDTASIGGVNITLGSTDETPAFDLSDATNYPTSSLVGTITNAQLAGSIATDKISDDAITFAKLGILPDVEIFTGNNSDSSFTLESRIPTAQLSDFKLMVRAFRNGQRMKQVGSSPADASEYTVTDNGSATLITMGAAPDTGEVIMVDYWKPASS